MKNAAEVFSAYLVAETNISDRIDSTERHSPEERDLLNQLRAARLQADAANEQMWIIHTEEEHAREHAAT